MMSLNNLTSNLASSIDDSDKGEDALTNVTDIEPSNATSEGKDGKNLLHNCTAN